MNKRAFAKRTGYLSCLLAASIPLNAHAGAELSAGVWWVYQYVTDSDFTGASSAFDEDLDNTTGGNFADPALILYADDDGSHGPWRFSAEGRLGTGGFTDTSNNNSGDTFTMHKAWIGYEFDDDTLLTVGKSQVPFGWKTVNFWPGEGVLGGYGDQMDVGFKLSSSLNAFNYDVAYYHQDDWGETSTDTVDDNGHWGSATTYRKIKTGVINGDWNFMEGHTVGASYQKGRLQDLTAAVAKARDDEGDHQSVNLHYTFNMNDFTARYQFIDAERDFGGMDAFLLGGTAPADEEVKTQVHMAQLIYNQNRWSYYLDAGVASTDTRGNNADDVEFYAPGVSYKYGPGWLYLEYLWSDGDVDRNGDIYEADFRAVYASFDFYF